ncbi:MAG TPA: hypothetical protein VMT24_20120 [Aggregatilineaceae bacterium]|nr:hypothetical protein [Aggregatilineaceae bacterium]
MNPYYKNRAALEDGQSKQGWPPYACKTHLTFIAVRFQLICQKVCCRVMKLIIQGRLRQERGKLAVVAGEWIELIGTAGSGRFGF